MFDYEDYEWAEENGMFDSEDDNSSETDPHDDLFIHSREELRKSW